MRNTDVADQQALAAVQIGQIVAEQRNVDRPLVVERHDDDIADVARVIGHVVVLNWPLVTGEVVLTDAKLE